MLRVRLHGFNIGFTGKHAGKHAGKHEIPLLKCMVMVYLKK